MRGLRVRGTDTANPPLTVGRVHARVVGSRCFVATLGPGEPRRPGGLTSVAQRLPAGCRPGFVVAGERFAGGEVDTVLHVLEHGATSRRGLLPGQDRQLWPCRVAPAGVDQHDAGRLLRVLTGEQAREHPAVGVTDQQMAAGCRRRQVAVADRRSRRARRARRASAGCCRARRGQGARACRLAQLSLDVAPGRAVARIASLQRDRRAARSHALQIQPAPAADGDQTTPDCARRLPRATDWSATSSRSRSA